MGRKPTGRTTKVISIRVSNDEYNYLKSLITDKQSVNQLVKQIALYKYQGFADFKKRIKRGE
jgi:hypothetical protein